MGIEDELEKHIDQRVDQKVNQRFAGFLQRLAGLLQQFGSSSSEDAPDDEGGGNVRRGKKKKGKKKVSAIGGGKKRGKKKRGKTRGAPAAVALKPEMREKVIALLMQRGPMRVTQLVEITGVAQSTINKHLNQLRDERLVTSIKDANKVLYKAVHDGRMGRKTAEKGAKKTESVAPPASARPVAA